MKFKAILFLLLICCGFIFSQTETVSAAKSRDWIHTGVGGVQIDYNSLYGDKMGFEVDFKNDKSNEVYHAAFVSNGSDVMVGVRGYGQTIAMGNNLAIYRFCCRFLPKWQ